MQIPKPSEGGEFVLTPAGTFIATCYRFLDLGTQMTDYNGQQKTAHKILLSWEIADELMDDGRPFTISKRYTWSMHEKATLRKDLEAWRGKSFGPDDFEGPNAFNTKKLIGAACMLTITHTEKQGKTYANIASVGKLLKGVKPPPLVNPTVYLSLEPEGWDASIYGGLSDGLKSTIAASPEYREIMQNAYRHDDMGLHPGVDPEQDIPF